MSETAHFEDLTPYTHQIAPFAMDKVKNVGWLDLTAAFETGPIPAATFQKLRMLAGGVGVFQPLVEPIRELPKCQICGDLKLPDCNGNLLPNSELWIPAGHLIYAAPISILHYIEHHGYRPPAEYISAVDVLDISTPFVADKIYREHLITSGWFARGR